jgi:hypothetical protein
MLGIFSKGYWNIPRIFSMFSEYPRDIPGIYYTSTQEHILLESAAIFLQDYSWDTPRSILRIFRKQ